MDSKPEYYKSVNIKYSTDCHSIKQGKAWLAVDDNGKDLWTLENTNKVLLSNEIICWWY